jgi:hypothetical protein
MRESEHSVDVGPQFDVCGIIERQMTFCDTLDQFVAKAEEALAKIGHAVFLDEVEP